MIKPRTKQRDPMALLIEFGRQLNQVRGSAALHALLVATAQRLCSPTRTLLVLEMPGGPQIASSKLPRGESDAALLAAVTPWLNEAR